MKIRTVVPPFFIPLIGAPTLPYLYQNNKFALVFHPILPPRLVVLFVAGIHVQILQGPQTRGRVGGGWR